MLDQKRLNKFSNSDYRASYLEGAVRSSIAYQVQALRSKASLTQGEFASAIGKTQSVVSRLENPDYGKVTVQTLLDIAIARDVALVVRFVDYPTFFGFADKMAEEELQPNNVFESIANASVSRPVGTTSFAVDYATPQTILYKQLMVSADSLSGPVMVESTDDKRVIYAYESA